MKKLFAITSILMLSLTLAACKETHDDPDATAEDSKIEYVNGNTALSGDVVIFVDPDTKCHYIMKQFSESAFITPRMNPDGTQMCDR